MDNPSYSFEGPITEYRYEFTSISPIKEVLKVVRFSETSLDSMYNLVLLDRQTDGAESNDQIETRNKDMDKVLATVLKIVIHFLDENPNWFVYVEGSDLRRKRLYQILLNREYENLTKKYLVFAGNGTETEVFEKGKLYEFFIISKQ